MEDQIKAAGIPCVGKELMGLLYELNTQLLRERVLGEKADFRKTDVTPASRPPALCPGCPHRGFFYTLSKNKNYVVTGDIGCYTLGSAAPLNCMDSVVCMGAGFSAGMGIAKSFEREWQLPFPCMCCTRRHRSLIHPLEKIFPFPPEHP